MADRSVTIRLRVSSQEFDAAMARAGTEVKLLAKVIDDTGKSASGSGKNLDSLGKSADTAAGKVKTLSKNSQDASKDLKLLSTAIIGLGPALIPIGAVAAGALAGLIPTAATALLAFKGIKTEMANGTPIGMQYTAGMKTLSGELTKLESISAHGVLGGFEAGLRAVQPLFPTLNKDTAVFSNQLGQIVGHTAPALVSMFHQLDPLFVSIGNDLVGGAAGFERWAKSSDSVSKFVGYVQTQLPNVEHFLANTAVTVGHLAQGFAPFGGTVLQELTMFSRVLSSIPVGVLQTVIPLLAGAKVGMLGFNGAANAATSIEKVAAKAGPAAGMVGNLGKAVSFLGPVGLAAGIALGGLSLIMGRHQQAAADAATRVNQLTQAIENQKTSVGILAQLTNDGAVAAANKLGISQQTLVDSVMSGGAALDAVKGKIAATSAEYSRLGTYLSSAKAALDSTHDPQAYQAQLAQYNALGSALITLSSKLQQTQSDYAKAKQAAADYATSQGDALLASQVQSGAIDNVAKSLGMTADAYYSSKLAADQHAQSVQAATNAMIQEGDAAGLLKQNLDALNGVTLDVASAQTAAANSNLVLEDAVKKNGNTTSLLTDAGVKNRQETEAAVRASQAYATAQSKTTKSGTDAYNMLITQRTQFLKNIDTTYGATSAVGKYAHSLYGIPAKPTTAPQFDSGPAEAKIAELKTHIAGIPGSKSITVSANVSSAVASVQSLVAGINGQVAYVQVQTVGGAGPSGGVARGDSGKIGNVNIPGHASGGGVADGWFTVGERGFEVGYKHGNNVQIFPNAVAKQMMPAGSVPGYASGTPNASFTVSGWGGVVQAIVAGITSQAGLGKAAMQKLSQAMADGFDVRYATARLDALKQQAIAFQQQIFQTLTGRTNILQVGAGDNNPTGYIASAGNIVSGFNQQTAENNQFASYISTLGRRGVDKGYLMQLEQQGVSALPVLKLLVNSTKAQDIAVGKAYERSIASATGAANVAENQQFGPQIRAWTKLQTALTNEMRTFVRSATALSGRPIVLQLDGKTVYQSTLAQAAKAGRR